MSHWVICPICKQRFDRDKEEYVMYSARRYAHKKCAEGEQRELTKEELDKKALEDYVMKLLNEEYVNPRVQKQIKQFKEQYNYTYSGMLKALIYFYDIKKNDKSKANGGIGIIPYVWQDSFNYFYSIWEAQQKNADKIIEDFEPDVEEIFIKPPQRKEKKRSLFSFLDKEER